VWGPHAIAQDVSRRMDRAQASGGERSKEARTLLQMVVVGE